MKYSQIKETIPENETIGIQKPISARAYLSLLANSIATTEGKSIDSVTLGDMAHDLFERARGQPFGHGYHLSQNTAKAMQEMNEAVSKANQMYLLLAKYCTEVKIK